MFKFAVLLALAATASAFPRATLPAYLKTPTIDPNGSWRVVGGSDADAGAYPYMVSLRGPANNHFCGGSIVNSRTVLTAGHCLVGASPSQVNAVAGTNTLNAGGVSIGAQTLILHPEYSDETISNDVAVIILQAGFTFNNLIAPVSLDTANTQAVAVVLTGWGVTGVSDPLPNNLQRLDTQTITNSVCQLFWSISGSQICALSQAGQGACFGDSGGPLVITSNGNQAGIVSFGAACALGYPDVYARVASFTSWINSVASS